MASVVFIADDLAAWLIGLLADAGRKKLTTLIFGTEQERALRSAATAAVRQAAEELCPGDHEQAEHVALVISQVFGGPVADALLVGHQTVLEALQAGIAAQLAVLDDASLTGTGQSPADLLGVPGAVLAEKLTGHLVREIIVRGSQGTSLFPLASQLNHELLRADNTQLKDMVGQALELLARLEGARSIAAAPVALAQVPPPVAGFTGRDDELGSTGQAAGPRQDGRASGGVGRGWAGRGGQDRVGCGSRARRASAGMVPPCAVHRPARV